MNRILVADGMIIGVAVIGFLMLRMWVKEWDHRLRMGR